MATNQEPEVRTLKGNERPETIELEVEDLSRDIDEIDLDKYVDPGCGIGCGGAVVLFLVLGFVSNFSVPLGRVVGLLFIPLLFITRYREKRKQINTVKRRISKAKNCDHEKYDEESVCILCGLSDPNLEPSLRRIKDSDARSFKFEVGDDLWEIGRRVHITSDGETEVLNLEDVEVTSIGDKKKVKLMGDKPRMESISSTEKANRISKSIEQMRYRYEKS